MQDNLKADRRSAVGGLARTALALLAICLAACSQPAGRATTEEPEMATPAANTEALLFLACQGCHSLAPEAAHGLGPNLHGIFGQPAGTRPGYPYSEALASSGLVWDTATLTAWISAPEAMLPGTRMLYHNILEPEEVAALVEYLSRSE